MKPTVLTVLEQAKNACIDILAAFEHEKDCRTPFAPVEECTCKNDAPSIRHIVKVTLGRIEEVLR